MTSRPFTTTTPASSYTADPLLAPFIAPTFDPTAYLNSTLPSLGIATTQQPIIPSKSSGLSDLVSQTQTQLARLSAQESRLVDTLTTLTDEILRSGSRLAYEVELLRGEAVSLEEVLGTQLAGDVANFVPEKPPTSPEGARDEAEGIDEDAEDEPVVEGDEADQDVSGAADGLSKTTIAETVDPLAPPALARLRTLQHVRNSLQAVIGTFDAALSFPLPPSLLTQSTSATSFVSVVAPADPAQEAAGQEALTKLKASIFDHLDPGKSGEDGLEGVLAAEKRLEELRDLCQVWRGTSEEKARQKVIEGWERELQEAKDRIGVRAATGRTSQDRSRGHDGGRGGDGARENSRSRGLFGGLRSLGGRIYQE